MALVILVITNSLRILKTALFVLTPVALLMCAGCEYIGVASEVVKGEVDISPQYTGLAGQKVAIMVWADEGVSLDHPSINGDVARSLLGKLQDGIDAKLKELKGTTFVSVPSILHYQDAHPETQVDAPEQIAPHFPCTRMIYIEIDSLSLHPGEAIDLSRGQATADLKVIEVHGSQGKTAFQVNSISAIFPKDAPPEGVYGLSDDVIYHKTVDALTDEIGKLFMTHPSDEHD
jgi:hypothetical protein